MKVDLDDEKAAIGLAKKTKKCEFKQKYFTNNFYWVNENNYKQLQEIAINVGCICHTGGKVIINWHNGFKNLGFRTHEKNDNITVFQKEPFLINGENATSFEEMVINYNLIKTKE